MNGIKGLQFTLDYNKDVLSFVGIKGIDEKNIGLRYLEKGKITVSIDLSEIKNKKQLFTLVFEAKEKGELYQSIRLTSELTNAQAYNLADESVDLALSFTNNGEEIKHITPVLYQNEPNPFESYTNVSFEIPEDANAVVNIYNLEGKLVKKIEGNYKKGMNVITLEHGVFEKSGMYYYELKTSNFTDIKKMMYIK